jgi:hypothetical protein
MAMSDPEQPQESAERTARPSVRGPSAAEVRRARQKAALKANMARRKAQVRAVAARNSGQDDPASGSQDDPYNEKD